MNDTSSNLPKEPANGSFHETPDHLRDLHRGFSNRATPLGVGYEKRALDPAVHARLLAQLKDNVHNFTTEPGNDYLKTESRRSFPSLIHQDPAFNARLLEDLKPAHEEWCGRPLKSATCYGIRVYQTGSYLYSHVDTADTHVVSSTICVDHRLSGHWPLVIEDDEGKVQEVAVEPGEMVFYESARLLHGRPYALPGEYYANIFLHYTPLDWILGAPNQP